MIKYSLPGHPYPPQGCPSFLPSSPITYPLTSKPLSSSPFKRYNPKSASPDSYSNPSALCKRRTGRNQRGTTDKTGSDGSHESVYSPSPRGTWPRAVPASWDPMSSGNGPLGRRAVDPVLATRVTLLCSFSGVSSSVNSLTPRVPQNYYYYLMVSDPASCFTFCPPGLSLSCHKHTILV